MNDCPFCKRIAACEFDYSDPDSVAFQPLNPVTPGHFLVVPRQHAAGAFDDPDAAGKALSFAAGLAALMGLDSANFITSAGAAATQTVLHTHVHVVPRREGDGLHLPWTNQAAAAERAEVADLKIRLQAREDELSMHNRIKARAVDLAVAAVRDRFRLALLGCTVCGKVHQPQRSGEFSTSWHSPDDGHPYRPPFFGNAPVHPLVAALIDGTTITEETL